MYYLTAHNFKSIFTCNEKVAHYISKGIMCRVLLYGDKYMVCFGTYNDRESAKKAQAEMNVKTRIRKECD